MNITLFSFLMALFWSAIFIVLTYFLRKNNEMKKYYGVSLITTLYLLSFFRMFFPFEFGFTKVILLEDKYADFFEIFYFNKINSFIEISILALLLIIWVIVALFKIISFVYEYINISNEVMRYSEKCENDEMNILNTIKLEVNKDIKVNVYRNDLITIPIGLGLFKKSIILPNIYYTDDELYYILLHEYTHFLNKDVTVKIMSNVFSYIFWWFPPSHLLRKNLEQVLEIKCDLHVVKNMNNLQKTQYLTIILKTLKQANSNQKELVVGTALIQAKTQSKLEERFEAIMESTSVEKKSKMNLIFILVFVFINALSYSFVIQPTYIPDDTSTAVSIENAYILKTKDGKYLFYTDGVLNGALTKETVDIFVSHGYEILEEEIK